jgi:multiple sugar transport system ATP-binding protein
VTHDQQEAIGLADRLAVLEGGRLQQVGTPRELYEQPVNRFVASFLGRPALNLLPPRDGRQLGLRPEHLRPVTEGGLAARVLRREWWGPQQLLWLESAEGELRMLLPAATDCPEALRIGWDRRHELWFDAAGGASLPPHA